MKKLLCLSLIGLLFTTPVFAQDEAINFSQLLLTIAIVLGIVASAYVFTLSHRMGTGGISTALFLYGIGMVSVVVSLLSVTWLKSTISIFAGTAHDVFFIIGFILMVIGSRKISRLFQTR